MCVNESLLLWKGRLQWKQYIPYNSGQFWTNFSQAVTVGMVIFIIWIWTEISDQHRQRNHVSQTFRELLPHTVPADILHDHQINCTGTGQQTNFKHCLKQAKIKTTERGKPSQLLEKTWHWNEWTNIKWPLWAPFTIQNTNTDGGEATVH